MSRATVHGVWLMVAGILVAGAMTIPFPNAAAGHGPSSTGAGNELLRQFPLGNRRLCCTTRTASGAAPSAAGSTRSTSGAGNGAGGSSGPPARGNGGGSVGVVLAVVALISIALGGIAVLPRLRHRRTRPPIVAAGPAQAPRKKFASDQSVPAHNQGASDRAVSPDGPGGAAAVRKVSAATVPGIPADNGAGGPDGASSAAEAFNLALKLHERDELDGAALAYRRAEELGEPEAAFSLGVLLYESGDLAGAEATWRRCLKYQHARAATNLGFLLQERGDVRTALLAYSAGERWGDPTGRALGEALLRSVGGPPPPVRGLG